MRMLSSFGAAVCAVAILFTAGCSSSSDSAAEIRNVDELFSLGPYDVGYREMSITYTDAASMAPRELPLRVWYPADPGSDAEPARYAVADVIDIEANALDAPPVTEDPNLPLVIYSHGNGGEGLLGYPFGELMASHGWILVGPNHTGNTALELASGMGDPGALVALNRPLDISAIIDELESGLAGDDLEGKAGIDLGVFLFGHSFGGYTTFTAGGADVDYDSFASACETETSPDCDVLTDPNVETVYRAGFGDPRIVALAPQAPALVAIADGELGNLGVPTMLMTGRLDQTTTQTESAEPSWAGIDNPDDIWVEMPLGAHYSFITVCHDLTPDILGLFISGADEDGCGESFIDTRESVPVLAAYLLAFGRRHVLGETSLDAVLRGPPLGDEGDFIVTVK
jgi:predicted dienelactone hydrolase